MILILGIALGITGLITGILIILFVYLQWKAEVIANNEIIKALGQELILDKIRADIEDEKEFAYADFERYKVECLGQDWEDVLDYPPQDDFRYGLGRAIEIIDKYKSRK